MFDMQDVLESSDNHAFTRFPDMVLLMSVAEAAGPGKKVDIFLAILGHENGILYPGKNSGKERI